MANIFKDFDAFLAEREERKITVRIFGRDCKIPAEMPWTYMLKVERMLKGGESIRGEDNIAMVKSMLAPTDFEYVTGHPDFRASMFWELIAFAYLRADENVQAKGSVFKTEDEVKIAETRDKSAKKSKSAR